MTTPASLSNPEIGARLLISPRSVEYHLHKVFAKLNINSRNQLHGVLSNDPNAAQPAYPNLDCRAGHESDLDGREREGCLTRKCP